MLPVVGSNVDGTHFHLSYLNREAIFCLLEK